MADEVTVLPYNQPYTGHAKPFASVKDDRSYTEVKTYPDGILVTRHETDSAASAAIVLLPWDVIEALLPHHYAAKAHASVASAAKAKQAERQAKGKATRAEREDREQQRREAERHGDEMADGAASLADPLEE